MRTVATAFGFTVTSTTAVLPSAVAATCAEPALMPVTTPALEIVATAGSFDAQATLRPVSRSPAASRSSTASGVEAPMPTMTRLGTTTTDATAARSGSSASLLHDIAPASSASAARTRRPVTLGAQLIDGDMCRSGAMVQRPRAPTRTGRERWSRVPSPICPSMLYPQQYVSPEGVAAHVCAPLACTTATAGTLVTRTGAGRFTVVPSPSCPNVLLPQQ